MESVTVTIPPPVGPTVRRVAYVIRIGLCPCIVQRTCLVVSLWSSPVMRLIHTFPCCVSCVPPVLPLPAYYPIARVLGVVLVRLISLVIMRVGIRLHGTSYPMTDCVLYLAGLLCW